MKRDIFFVIVAILIFAVWAYAARSTRGSSTRTGGGNMPNSTSGNFPGNFQDNAPQDSQLQNMNMRQLQQQEQEKEDNIIIPDSIGDPEKIQVNIKKYDGLENQLQTLDTENRRSQRDWLNTSQDNKIQLLKATRRQMQEEMKILRNIAQQGNTEKTIAAIEGIMLKQYKYYTGLIEELEQQRIQMMNMQNQQNMQMQQDRTTNRNTRGRSTTTTTTRRRRG